MKKSDLHREWARVLDMCEGTEVSPGLCWKLDGFGREQDCIPKFNCDGGSYEFAVAILGDKPVFVGYNVYAKLSGERFDWDDPDHVRQIKCENLSVDPEDVWTLNPQKKTFMLNGEELPCPESDGKWGFKIGIDHHVCFKTRSDCLKVQQAIHKLLTDNTK